MAAQYYLYCTTLNNTVINRSDNSFAPLPPNTGELLYDILIPQTQPLYLYRESGSTIIHNTQEEIEEYLEVTTPPPTPDDYVKYSTFIQYTGGSSGTTWGDITGTLSAQADLWNNLTGKTSLTVFQTYTGTTAPNTFLGKAAFNTYSGTTIPNTYYSKVQTNSLFVNVSGDTMTGSLSTSGNFTAGGLVSGSSVCGGVWINSPFVCATTKVQSPIITGSTCVTSPRILGTTCVSAPITCGTSCVQTALLCSTGQVKGTILTGSTCAISPITIGTTCVCSPRILGSTSVCSPIITGSTCVTSPITCGLTRVQSPIVCGSTCVASPITCGTTCLISPITIGSTCVCSPVVLGSTSVCSPTICSSTCLCSVGTTRLAGGATAASFLNVSGATKIVGITQCEIVFGNPTTCALTGNSTFMYNATGCTLCVPYIKKTGGGAYFYTESLSKVTEAAGTCKVYLSGTPWNFQAGTYRVDINANAGNGSSNGCTLVRITCDGLGTANSIHGSDFLLRSQTANFGFSTAVSRDMVFTAGCHCLIVQFWRGANTACITYASIRAERIC